MEKTRAKKVADFLGSVSALCFIIFSLSVCLGIGVAIGIKSYQLTMLILN